MYFAPPLKRLPLKLGAVAEGQNLEWWGYRAEEEVDDIFSRVDTMH